MLLNKESLVGQKILEESDKSYKSYIKITPDGKTYSTNRIVAIVITPPDQNTKNFPICRLLPADAHKPDREFYVTKKQAEELTRAIPQKPSIDILQNMVITQTDGATLATTTDLDTEKTLSIRNKDVSYPNIEDIIPKEEPIVSFQLNPAYLKTLCEIAIATSEDDKPVNISFYGELKPVKLTTNNKKTGQTFTALIMPQGGV
jgi:hypothetical protein